MKRTYSSAARAARNVQKAGEYGETLTLHALRRLGYLEIERVHTPFKIIRGSDGKIINAVPVEAVSGDFRAIEPGTGRSVLVEAKFDSVDRVLWSDLESHQIAALDGHVKAGAVALLSVVLLDKAWVLQWPVSGFGPGRSIRILEGRLKLSGNGKGASSPKEGGAPVVQVPTSPTGTKVHLLSISGND